MDRAFKDKPLAESSVSHKLSEIQERCTKLLQESGGLDDLTLEGEAPVITPDGTDPYNHG